jgi:hypothetical protein
MKKSNKSQKFILNNHETDVGFNCISPTSKKKDGVFVCCTPSSPNYLFKSYFSSSNDSYSLSQISIKTFGGKLKWDY